MEHIFDGYYFPYNFPNYNYSEDEKYFYSPLISAENGNIQLLTYNEDYSVRERYDVCFSIPQGYKVQSLSFSSALQLADGTPFFIVVFTSTQTDYGKANYTIANMYDARNGSLIFNIGSASASIQLIGNVYKINSKPSICVLLSNATQIAGSYGYQTSYITRVYSLGNPPADSINPLEDSASTAEPIRTYDIKGRLISTPDSGQPYIGVMPDGSSQIRLAR